MKPIPLVLALVATCIAPGIGAAADPSSNAILANLDSAKWIHDKGDPPGLDSVFLREDSQTGGMEILVRFPAGHTIKPHYHDVNERLIVLDGQITVRQDQGETALNAGGFAFMPAREVQRLSCSSNVRCTVYLSWDGNNKSHAAK